MFSGGTYEVTQSQWSFKDILLLFLLSLSDYQAHVILSSEIVGTCLLVRESSITILAVEILSTVTTPLCGVS